MALLKLFMEQRNKVSIAILGGEGFIGRNLAWYLSDFYECFSIGRRKSFFLNRKDTFIPGHPYDEKMGKQYSAIVHLMDNSRCAPEYFLDEEKKLVKNLDLDDKKQLILFSSAVVYANPESEYGLRKRALEEFYSDYCKENNVKLAIVRLFNTFGPFQIPQKQGSLIANIICNYMVGRASEISSRSSERDFLYAGDIPKFIEYILKGELTGTFDLGSGRLTSIGDIISALESDVLEDRLDIIDKDKPDGITSPAANNPFLDKIPPTDLVSALSQTVAFYKDNIDSVEKYVH